MPNRPQPRFPEPHTQPFWEGAQNGKLMYQVDKDNGDVVFYPRLHNPKTGGLNLEWRESAGLGTVYTYSVVRQSGVPGFRELGAYSVAYVDLDEGFRILTSIVGVDDPTQDIKIGMRVKVEFEKQDEGDYPIPVFRPA
jgi:uncharacterized protein